MDGLQAGSLTPGLSDCAGWASATEASNPIPTKETDNARMNIASSQAGSGIIHRRADPRKADASFYPNSVTLRFGSRDFADRSEVRMPGFAAASPARLTPRSKPPAQTRGLRDCGRHPEPTQLFPLSCKIGYIESRE